MAVTDREGAISLFSREAGKGGVPVVLLHGFGGSHAVWAPIQDALAGEAATLAFDLPGHGGSGAIPPGSPRAAAKAVLAELAARGIERAHLVGHSMGGAVCTLAAMAEPSRVASLTLLAPGGFGPEINHRLLRRFAAAADEAALLACLEAMFGWTSPVPPGTVADLHAARAAPGAVERLVALGETLARDGRQGELPREALAALAMPVRVAWGGLDNVLPVRHARGLPPHFAVHLFPDLGHMLPEEAPSAMLALIRLSAGLDIRDRRA